MRKHDWFEPKGNNKYWFAGMTEEEINNYVKTMMELTRNDF